MGFSRGDWNYATNSMITSKTHRGTCSFPSSPQKVIFMGPENDVSAFPDFASFLCFSSGHKHLTLTHFAISKNDFFLQDNIKFH